MSATPPAPSTGPGTWKSRLLSHEMLLFYVLIALWLFFYFAGTTVNRSPTSAKATRLANG